MGGDSVGRTEGSATLVVSVLANALIRRVNSTVVMVAVVSGMLVWVCWFRGQYYRQMRYQRQLHGCKRRILEMLHRIPSCAPILLRLAWSDACTYNRHLDTSKQQVNNTASFNSNPGKRKQLDKSNSDPSTTARAAESYDGWPACGGCNGSIRFEIEVSAVTVSDGFNANAGLEYAIEMLLPIKHRYTRISWADLIQLGGCIAVEFCDGPSLLPLMRFGRVDAPEDKHQGMVSSSSANNRYPKPFPPYPQGAKSADNKKRNEFYRLVCTNEEIVALCGAHTIGRAFANRTGVCPYSSGDAGATMYTASHWNPKVCNAVYVCKQT
jgi:catalase (peroxidase I)